MILLGVRHNDRAMRPLTRGAAAAIPLPRARLQSPAHPTEARTKPEYPASRRTTVQPLPAQKQTSSHTIKHHKSQRAEKTPKPSLQTTTVLRLCLECCATAPKAAAGFPATAQLPQQRLSRHLRVHHTRYPLREHPGGRGEWEEGCHFLSRAHL